MSKIKETRIYERIRGDMIEHHHEGYDYWHYAFRIHIQDNEIELPPSHIRPKSEKGYIFHCFDITIEDIREIAKSKRFIARR